MAKNDFPKPTPAQSYPLGHAKENKDASSYTEFKYPAGGGKDIGIYKQPMPVPAKHAAGEGVVSKSGNHLTEANISVGGVSKGNYAKENPYGVGEMRGYGAATKGRKISGKMG